MVHKTSFRGVYSGNTLRASNTRFSRRYHNQACIVSTVGPELLKKMTAAAAAAAATTTTSVAAAAADTNSNIAVGVALSLNKQSRWLLPSALLRQIRSNDIARSDLTVSLLERHKLKRPASCVGFHSNQGQVKRIQPRNGRYFSFAYPTADGQSRRAARRERMREERGRKKEKVVAVGGPVVEGPVVELFTELGQARKEMERKKAQMKQEVVEESDVGELEVRYEVYYPTSVHSSLSHNPKYIKQDVSSAHGDFQHVQHGKPRRQHRGKQRKRMTLSDLDDCDLPSWHHHQASDLKDNDLRFDLDEGGNLNLDRSSSDDAATVLLQGDGGATERGTVDCLLASLLHKSRQLQQKVGGAKTRRSKKSDSGKTAAAGRHYTSDKSHIVYLPQDLEDDDGGDDGSDNDPFSIPPSLPALAQGCRVVLPTGDVTAASLEETFGRQYLEAACQPRRFVLDVTCDVRDVLQKGGVPRQVAQLTDQALAFLVFVHHGCYDAGLDVYRVSLNSKLGGGATAVPLGTDLEDDLDLQRASVLGMVGRSMDHVASLLTELPQDYFPSHLPFPAPSKAPQHHYEHEHRRHLGTAEAYVPSLQRLFLQSPSAPDVTLPALSDMLQAEPALCQVCYDDVSPLTPGSAPSTSLGVCGHVVCDACWGRHIHTRLQQGFLRLTCPGHTCQHEVGVGALLSLAPLPTVEKLLLRQEESRVGGSRDEKWCPNQACGRVIRLHNSSSSTTLQRRLCDDSTFSSSFSSSQLDQSSSASSSQLHAPDPSQLHTSPSPSSPFISQLLHPSSSQPDQSPSPSLSPCELQRDVVCACGAHVCFRCLAPAHWPASCGQARQYRHDLDTLVLPDRQADIHEDPAVGRTPEQRAAAAERARQKWEENTTIRVEGKHCPRCHSFVLKEGGCPQMTCRCGTRFCWFCARPGVSHPNRLGCVDEVEERRLTTTLLVRHLDPQRVKEEEERREEEKRRLAAEEKESRKHSGRRRQRVSLLERAVEHRRHRLGTGQSAKVIASMVRAVAKATAKDAALARHVSEVCSASASPSWAKTPTGVPFPASPSRSLLPSSDKNPSPSPVPSSSSFSPSPKLNASPSPLSSSPSSCPWQQGGSGVPSISVQSTVSSFLHRVAGSQREVHEVAEYTFILLKDLPDSLLRLRALRIAQDLGAFCSFTQSVFDAWDTKDQGHLQEAVKAVTKLAEIQGWIRSALAAHVVTVRKIRGMMIQC